MVTQDPFQTRKTVHWCITTKVFDKFCKLRETDFGNALASSSFILTSELLCGNFVSKGVIHLGNDMNEVFNSTVPQVYLIMEWVPVLMLSKLWLLERSTTFHSSQYGS